MIYNIKTGIFEDRVVVHPNIINSIISEFNGERIQKLVKMNALFGEIPNAELLNTTDIIRISVVKRENAVIEILSVREEFDNLIVGFKFLDNDVGNQMKELYIQSPDNYKIKVRGFSNYEKTIFILITFDFHIDIKLTSKSPVNSNRKAFSLRSSTTLQNQR